MTMKTLLLLLLLTFSTSLLFAQKLTRKDYILKYQNLAIKEMTRSGVPASITMAQACLESADGNSSLAKKSNNHFGIKCKSNWSGPKVFFDDDENDECFRKYKRVEDSFADHSNFLRTNFRYGILFTYKTTDYKKWAKGLKKAGYATAPHYDKRLIAIIEANKLYKLDKKIAFDQLASFEQKSIQKTDGGSGILIDPYQTRKVQLRNGLKSIAVRNGDSFESIAQEFGLKNWEIYAFNDYIKGYQPQPNEILYLQPKKLRTKKYSKTHTIKQGESMHMVSQMYGIKMRPLYKRNRLKYGEAVQVGQVINLRKKVKKSS